MPGILEHVNITVGDPERSAQRFVDLFDWKVRWRGPAQMGGWTVHVGADDGYLALYSPKPGQELAFQKGAPLNHVGIEVADLDETEARVRGLGFAPFAHGDYEPGRRFYFFDDNGIEFEVVSYA